MTIYTDPTELQALARTVCPVFDGKAPTGTTGPYVVLRGGTTTPNDRLLDGRTPWRRATYSLLCVSDSRASAARVATRIVDAVDGQQTGGAPWLVELVADPLEDTGDPSAWRWSSTVLVAHYT